jgi:SAM-dependent methyltransferase
MANLALNAVKSTRVDDLLPFLACPSCHSGVMPVKQGIGCSNCGALFPLREGRPVFVSDPDSVKLMPIEHVSNTIPTPILDWLTWLNGHVLNLGAGGTQVKLNNCIEVEYSLFRHTDVVADAHHLPFRDEVFDAVVTFNTFEHLREPDRAASEVYRVLKPGGKLVLHTAFLQPVHEAPYHFYNTTEYGLRHWFRNLTITKLEVSDNFSPAHVIAWMASELLQAVESTHGREAARELGASPLSFWHSTWVNRGERKHPLWKRIGRLPQEIQCRLAAGFHLEAVKPGNGSADGT